MTSESAPPRPRTRIVLSTHWTELKLAAEARSARPDAREAFEAFCRRYRSAVQAMIRSRFAQAQAEDLTQKFFLKAIIERDALNKVDRERGRFRSWLYRAVHNFMIDELRNLTRPGADVRLEQSFDELHAPVPFENASEFERLYARAIAERVFDALHSQWAPKLARHGAAVDKRTLITWLIDRDSQAIASVLNIRTDHARKLIERLFSSVWKLLRAEVADTVADDASLAIELREICQILGLQVPDDDIA